MSIVLTDIFKDQRKKMNKKIKFISPKNFIFIFILLLSYQEAIFSADIIKSEKNNSKINKSNPGTSKRNEKSKNSKKDDKKKELEKEKKKAAYIEKTLNYGLQSERKEAINKIKLIKNKKLQHKLVKKLIEIIETENNPDIRIKAIYAVGELNASEGIESITKNIYDEVEDVAIAAVYALKRLNAISAKDKLINMLKKQDFSKDSNLILALLETLGKFRAKEIIAMAIEKIKENKTSTMAREALIIFLGRLESNEPKNFLISLYKDRDENLQTRSYAVNSLANLGIREASETIKDVLEEINSYPFKKRKRFYNLKIYSIAALARLGDKDAIPVLMNSLKSDNAKVRLMAIKLIKELKDKRTIDILKYKIKYDPNQKVRREAEKVLKLIEEDVRSETKEKTKENKNSPENKATEKSEKNHTEKNRNKKSDAEKSTL